MLQVLGFLDVIKSYVGGVRHWSPRSRTRLASVRCLVASACRHVRRAIGRRPGTLVIWLARSPLGIFARGGPRAGRSAAGGGASVCCGGPPASSVASTMGSSPCGWAGGAGGVAAPPAYCAASRFGPSGTGVGPGWPPTWPASARVPPVPSAEAGLAAGVPPSGCRNPVGSSRPGASARGASAGTVARVGSGFGSQSGLGAGHSRMAFPWAVLPVQLVAGGSWCCWNAGSACAGAGGWHPRGRCAGCRCSLGTGAPGGVVGVGAYGAEGLLGPGADGVGRGSGTCLCGRTFGRRVWGALCRPDWWAVVWAAGGWPRMDALGGVWGCGAGSSVGPGPGLVCRCTLPRGCSGLMPAVAVFVGLGMVPLPAGDARCSRLAVAAWCCGWCRCPPRLDAHSCRGLCGVPAPDGAGTPVVRVASVACGRCAEWTVAWGRGDGRAGGR